MGVQKNYSVLLIEPLRKEVWEGDSKYEKFYLDIKVELIEDKFKEQLSVGGVAILDEAKVPIEFLKLDDGGVHYWRSIGGKEGLKPIDYYFPISEQAYKRVKDAAWIRFIVEEDGKRHYEELLVNNGLYSYKMLNKREE